MLSEMSPDKPVMINDVMTSVINEHGQYIDLKDVDEVVEYTDRVIIR